LIVLTLRTDKPEAELGVYDDKKQLAYIKWQAHRELAETTHVKIREILNKSSKSLKDVEAIVVYKGPGSFTGLRIGLSVANALAYSLNAPIVGVTSEDWIEKGISKLKTGKNSKIALPLYGSEPHITTPK